MMKAIRIIWVLCFLLIARIGHGQILALDLEKIRQAYLNAEDFSAKVSVSGFKTKEAVKPMQIGTGILKKTKNGYYSKFAEDEMVINEKHTIIINHLDKTIKLISGSAFSYLKESTGLLNVDTLLAQADSVVSRGLVNGMKLYSFYGSDSPVYRTDISVNEKTLFIQSIIYYYRESDEEDSYDMDRVLIQYQNISVTKPDRNIFSDKNYIGKEKGKLVGIGAYRGYKLTVIENEKI